MSSSKVSAALTRLREIDQKYRTRKVEDDSSSESLYDLQKVERKNGKDNKMDIKIPLPVESVSASESQRSEKQILFNQTSERKSESLSRSVQSYSQRLKSSETEDLDETIEEEIETKSSPAESVSELIKIEDYDETFESESQLSETTDASGRKRREKSKDSTFSKSQSERSKKSEPNESTEENKTDNISKSEQNVENDISGSKSSSESQKSSSERSKLSNLSKSSNKSEQSLEGDEIPEEKYATYLKSDGQNTETESSLKSNKNSEGSSEKGNEEIDSAENNLPSKKSEQGGTDVGCEKSISDRKSMRSKSEKEEEPSDVCVKESLKPLMGGRDKLDGPAEAGRQTRKAGRAPRNKRFFAKKHIRKINQMQEREELEMMKNSVANRRFIQPLEFPYLSSFILPDEIETAFSRDLATERHLHLQRRLLDIKQWLKNHLQVYHRQCRMAKEIDSSYCPTTLNDTRKMIREIRRTINAK